jgi:hypothetical protein
MREDNTQSTLRARLGAMKAAGRAWLLPFCVGLIAGLIVLPLIGLVWLSRGPESSPALPAAAVTAAPPPQAEAAGEPANASYVVFAWRDDEGVLRRAGVDREHYDEFVSAQRRQLEADAQAMSMARASRPRAGLAPIFEEIDERVPAYADWAFDWWTSWILLAKTFRWTWEGLMAGSPFDMPDRVQARLVQEIEQQFAARVIEPVTLESKMTASLDASGATSGDGLSCGSETYQGGQNEVVHPKARRVERQDPARGWAPDPAWDAKAAGFAPLCDAAGNIGQPPASAPSELSRSLELTGTDSPINDVIVRLARPFATKLISFIVLPVIAAALLGGFLLPLFGLLPNVLANIVTGILTGAAGALIIGFAASTSVDWLLSRTDAALNRAGFEVSVHNAVFAAEYAFEARMLGAQQRATEQRLQAMATTLAGKIAVP